VVIDQETFVAAGKSEFATENLRFRASIGECLSQDEPSVALLSSVLPFLEKPYAVLEEFWQPACGRSSLIERLSSRLQGPIDRSICSGDSRRRLLSRLVPEPRKVGGLDPNNYRILSTFEALDGTWRLSEPFDLAPSWGYVLVKK